jgi:phosphate:Na+ symporter
MTLQTVITAAGGLALFLLGMLMMTDGLKTFAGAGLRQMLARGTATPLRGVLSGVAVTALVQSSSAVTIATIGFVNPGMLTLRQALGVVFGTNVGTTMTGWLVSLVGFGWKIDNLALPLLTVGVVLRLAADQNRLRGLGEALAGFGLFFLALSLLQGAFADFAATHGSALVSAGGAGILVTTLTQSSSAALAIILSAASSGLVVVVPEGAPSDDTQLKNLHARLGRDLTRVQFRNLPREPGQYEIRYLIDRGRVVAARRALRIEAPTP